MKERLQKLMSMAGVSSRRGAEDLIKAGRVRVNGKVATLGDGADLTTDVVEVDGVKLNAKAMQARVYYAIHKPRNVLASKTERHDDDRKTVYQFVPYKGHLFSIGRLDADSEGLVVLTNDGEMAQRLSHPRYKHTKTYRVVVEGLPTAETIQRWENGVFLEEGRTAPCFVRVSKGDVKETVLHIVMTEGKKRQIRRVASILGHPAIRLTRIAIGKLELGNLKPGEFRALEPEDIEKLTTPAPELKTMRTRRATARRPTREGDSPEIQPRGAAKDDDVRSDRQRRSARGERLAHEVRPTGDRPPVRRFYAPGDDAPGSERPPFRPRRDDDAPRGERPAFRPRRDDNAPRSERPPYRPRRDDDAPRGDRPAFRPRRDDDAPRSDRPAYSPRRDDDAPRGERPPYRPRRDVDAPRGDRPAYRPRRDDDAPHSDRPRRDDDRPAARRPRPASSAPSSDRPRRSDDRPPARRPSRRPTGTTPSSGTSRPGSRRPSGSKPSGGTSRPGSRRPTTRRRRDE
jgi:23S rRNA pseudouridine2605 synthase